MSSSRVKKIMSLVKKKTEISEERDNSSVGEVFEPLDLLESTAYNFQQNQSDELQSAINSILIPDDKDLHSNADLPQNITKYSDQNIVSMSLDQHITTAVASRSTEFCPVYLCNSNDSQCTYVLQCAAEKKLSNEKVTEADNECSKLEESEQTMDTEARVDKTVSESDADEPFQSSVSEYVPDGEDTSAEEIIHSDTIAPSEERTEGRKNRGRKRKILNQTRSERKKFANNNRRYISSRNKVIEPKVFNHGYSCKCSKKCTDTVDIEIRRRLFDQFWTIGNFEGRCAILAKCVKEINKKRCYSKNANSRRSKSKIYMIEEHQVCKEAFLHTLQINHNRVRVALDQMMTNNIKDKRGISGGRNCISEERLKTVINHISSFPTFISHYCRSQTDAKFLNPDLNLQKMYSLYKEKYNRPVSLSKYKQIFYTKFNLRFKTPYKDTCKMCDTYVAQLTYSEVSKREELKALHMKHLQIAEELRAAMNYDLKNAQEDETIETLTFDMQKTHPIPKVPTGIAYYKRQLNLYNLGIFVGSSRQGVFNVWLEYEAGRGTQEVGSCLRKFINENIKHPVKTLNLWSDSCGGQNRSIKLVLMLIHILQNHASLESISIKFLLSGHSFLPNDSHFGDVECFLKTQQRLYTANDYIEVMKDCRRKKKFIVNRITNLDMFSVRNLEKAVTNRKVDINKESINWLKVHEILLKKENPTTLFMRNHTTDQEYTEVNIEKSGKGRKPELKRLELPLLWPEGRALSVEKVADLKEILKLIPQDARGFYNFLRSTDVQDFQEDIEGIGASPDFEIDVFC